MYTIILTVCHREGDHQIDITKEFPAFDTLSVFYKTMSDALQGSDTFILKFEVTPDPIKQNVNRGSEGFRIAPGEVLPTQNNLPGPYTGQERP